MPARPASGGGRWVDVDPTRLPGWLNGFAGRHGAYGVTGPVTVAGEEGLHIAAADGSTVALFPPPGVGLRPDVEGFIVDSQRERRIGLLLARQAAVAVGTAFGGTLTSSKVDTFYVQSRTAAGGWSQQRYARRRGNQAKAAAEHAADVAVRLLLPAVPELSTVVTGGDRRTVEAILADPRLAPVLPLRATRFLDVPDPRQAVLEQAIPMARAVRLLITDPA